MTILGGFSYRKGLEFHDGVRAAALVLSCAAVGQSVVATTPTAWQLLDDGDPSTGAWPMAYDIARSRAVMLVVGRPPITWELAGEDWVRRFPSEPTPWQHGGCMAYDSVRAMTVLFGGVRNDETWEYDGMAWTRRELAVRPPARWHCSMVYDSGRSRMVLFGVNTEERNDTWACDGVTWTRIALSGLPGVRRDHGLAYDPLEDSLVTYGGQDFHQPQYYTDTWLFDGGSWQQDTDAGSITAGYSTP